LLEIEVSLQNTGSETSGRLIDVASRASDGAFDGPFYQSKHLVHIAGGPFVVLVATALEAALLCRRQHTHN
jgi:hypothetical protein